MESSFPSFLHTKDPDVKLPWIHRVKCELPRRVGRLAGDLPVKASYIGRAWQGAVGSRAISNQWVSGSLLSCVCRTYWFTYLGHPRQQQSFVFGGKLTFGGASPQTALFRWDGSFWILNGSSKLWRPIKPIKVKSDVLSGMGFSQFHRSGREFRRIEEHIIHACSLKTSTKKVTHCTV